MVRKQKEEKEWVYGGQVNFVPFTLYHPISMVFTILVVSYDLLIVSFLFQMSAIIIMFIISIDLLPKELISD